MSPKKFRLKFRPVAAAIVASCIFLPMSASLSADPDTRAKAQQDAREFANDAMITARVKTALLTDKRVGGLAIDVDTIDGVVTLKGEVDDAAQIDQAEKLATGVEGVQSVSSSLVVGRDSAASSTSTSAKGDEERGVGRAVDDGIITGKVKTAVVADAEINGLMIDVDTNRGVVTLSGQVETKAQSDKVTKIAGQTEGVDAVNNQLSVKDASKQSGDGYRDMNLVQADSARVHSVHSELIAHRMFDSSPLARYRPLPLVPSPAFESAMDRGSI